MTTGVHRENHGPASRARPLLAVSVVLVLLDVVVGLHGVGLGLGIIGLAASLVLWSAQRYLRITVRPGRLRVGRESFGPPDFDTAFGVQSADALTDHERALVEEPLPIPRGESVRIAGRSYGRTSTFGMVVLARREDAVRVVVMTRDPQLLGAVLDRWLGGAPL